MTAASPASLPQMLDQLEALHAAGTSGPWRQDDEFPKYFGTGESQYIGEAPGSGDARLIVAAVNATPALVAEVRRLTDIVRGVQELAGEWAAKCPPDDWPSEGGIDTAIVADCGRAIRAVLGAES